MIYNTFAKTRKEETAVDHLSTERLLFEDIQGKKIEADFDGGQVTSDTDTLRTDPALKMACDQLPEGEASASQPTLSRLENAVARTDLYRIGSALADSSIDSYRTLPVAILLDIDDTADITHGHQQLALLNACYDEFCYLPIHIYEGRSGKLITTILRPGRRPSGKEIVARVRQLRTRVKIHLPTSYPWQAEWRTVFMSCRASP